MKLALALCISFLVFACSTRADLKIEESGKTAVMIGIDLAPQFEDYIRGIAETLGYKGKSIFDETRIREKLKNEKGITLQSMVVKKGRLELAITLDDIGQTLNSEKFKNLASFKKSSKSEINLSLGPKFIALVIGFAEPDKDSSLTALLPQKKGITKKAYEEQIAWALGDYGKKAEIIKLLSESKITVGMQTPKPIQSLSGFKKTGEKLAVFEIGLSELFTLADDRKLSVSW